MQRLTSATRPQRLADASDSFRQPMHDEACLQPQHAPAKPGQVPVSALVGGLSRDVIAAIHFNDQAHAGGSEICNVATDGHLPPEGHTQLGATELLPQLLLTERELLPQRMGTSASNWLSGLTMGATHVDLLSRLAAGLRPSWRRLHDAPSGRGTHAHA